MDSWYRHGLMVLTTPMVLTSTHGIVSVLMNNKHTRGPSVASMRDFLERNVHGGLWYPTQPYRIACDLCMIITNYQHLNIPYVKLVVIDGF